MIEGAIGIIKFQYFLFQDVKGTQRGQRVGQEIGGCVYEDDHQKIARSRPQNAEKNPATDVMRIE